MIAAAVCRMSLCEQDKESTFQCNVERALYLAQYFAQRGITPILFSTDYVYDGIAGDYTEASRPNPLNEYGRQKVVLEELLPSVCGDNYLLIRPGKVFGLEKGDKTLFDEMASHLTQHIPIRAAYDQIFSPIAIQDLIQAVFSLQRLRLKGVFNICGQEKWSRYDLGLKIAEKLLVPLHLVEPISLDDLKETFKRPKCTTMRLDKLLQNIEIEMTSMEEYIEKIAFLYASICHHS
jgi:dTDP-4-dehydrorhamnose reductase